MINACSDLLPVGVTAELDATGRALTLLESATVR